MARNLSLLALIAAVVLAWSGGVLAQSRLDRPDIRPDIRMVDAKVMDIERRPHMVTMLLLDNGTSLNVPPEGEGPGERAKVGDTIVARYTETGTGRLAMQVRVIETQSP